MAGISPLVCVNNAIRDTGTFHNPGELRDAMKRNLRQLSVDADAETVAGFAILLAHDFPSFAERVVNALLFILETEAGARKAVFVMMVINKLVLQRAVILGPSNPYAIIVNRLVDLLLHAIYCHGGDVLNTFRECIRSWIMRGIYSPGLWQEVVQLEATWSRRARMFQRPHDNYNSLAENSPDILDLVWVGIAWALPCDSRYIIKFDFDRE